MKAPLSFLVVLLHVMVTAEAKPPKNSWRNGTIITAQGELKTGLVNFDHKTQLVRIKQGDQTSTYSARQVNSFSYFNKDDNQHHKFSPYLRYNEVGQDVYDFYEVVFLGEVDFLRRKRKHLREELKLARGYDHLSKQDRAYLINQILDFDYFFYYNSTFYQLEDYRKILIPTLLRDFPGLEQKIDLDQALQAAKLVDIAKNIQLINIHIKENFQNLALTEN